MARVNQACSDASYLKVMAVSIPVFVALMYVPFTSLLGFAGYYFLLFATPVMAVRWWVRFGRIKTEDQEFRSAKRTTLIVGKLVPLLLLYQLAKIALVHVRTLR